MTSSPALLPVHFTGAREAAGPLTFGQRNTLNWVVQEANESGAVIQWILTLPDGVTLADVAAAFETLLSRHEALRTTFVDGEQRVVDRGVLPIEIHQDATVEDLAAALRVDGVGYASGLPLRVAIGVTDEVPTAGVVLYSHVAVDFGSVAQLGREFVTLVSDPAARLVEPSHQPLDQATLEQSPRGRKAAEAALRYWESHLRTAPQSLYPVPPPDEPIEALRTAVLVSPAAGRALGRISARTRMGRPVILLAAVCAVLAWRTGINRCVFASVSGNRFRLRLREYVGSLAQDGLLALDVEGPTFDALVARAAKATLAANNNSMFDAAKLWRLIEEVCHERGTAFTRDFSINDLSTHLDEVDFSEVIAPTELHWMPSDHYPIVLMCNPARLAPELMLALTANLRYVSVAETEALLRGVEGLLVAAGDGDVPLDRVGAVSGVTPVERDADWLLVDGCWVRLSAIRRLVADTVEGPTWVTADGLVGYVTVGSPEEAHAACMARLAEPGRHVAMAPRYYVVCEGAPKDNAGWQTQPVRAEGSGRVKREA